MNSVGGFTLTTCAPSSQAICAAYPATSTAVSPFLSVVVWSYPRGEGITDKKGETAVDVAGYAAHIACELGAHVVKVKPPTEFIYQPEAQKVFEKYNIPIKTLAERVRHVVQSSFNGKRIVIFSG